MKTSDNVTELYASFVKFQAEVKQPKKNATNPFYKSKYTTLDEIINTVNPLLGKHGLAIIQEVTSDGASVSVTTRLIHESGQWLETEPMTLKGEKATPQGQGSATSYGRRYALSAILGISSEDDDDGNIAETKKTKKKRTKSNGSITDNQIKRLYAIANSAGVNADTVKASVKQKLNKEVSDLTKKEYDNVCNGYEKLKESKVEKIITPINKEDK